MHVVGSLQQQVVLLTESESPPQSAKRQASAHKYRAADLTLYHRITRIVTIQLCQFHTSRRQPFRGSIFAILVWVPI